jgi:hypothetical protein
MTEQKLLIICLVVTILLGVTLLGIIWYVGVKSLINVFSKSMEDIVKDLEEMRDTWNESDIGER